MANAGVDPIRSDRKPWSSTFQPAPPTPEDVFFIQKPRRMDGLEKDPFLDIPYKKI